MKRIVKLFSISAVLAIPSLGLLAQTGSSVTVWKLNVSKSQFGAPPRSMTRTLKTAGDVTTLSFEGISAEGTRMSYSYMTKFDGKGYPVMGSAAPGTVETMAVTRIDAKTTQATGKKTGKIVLTSTNVLSNDGKVLIATSHAMDKEGHPTTSIAVWEKQ